MFKVWSDGSAYVSFYYRIDRASKTTTIVVGDGWWNREYDLVVRDDRGKIVYAFVECKGHIESDRLTKDSTLDQVKEEIQRVWHTQYKERLHAYAPIDFSNKVDIVRGTDKNTPEDMDLLKLVKKLTLENKVSPRKGDLSEGKDFLGHTILPGDLVLHYTKAGIYVERVGRIMSSLSIRTANGSTIKYTDIIKMPDTPEATLFMLTRK